MADQDLSIGSTASSAGKTVIENGEVGEGNRLAYSKRVPMCDSPAYFTGSV